MIPAIHQFAWQLVLAAQSFCGGTDYIVANMPVPLGEYETVVLAENGKIVTAAWFENGWFEEVGKCGEFAIYERMDQDRIGPFAYELREQQNQFEGILTAAGFGPPPEPEPVPVDDQ